MIGDDSCLEEELMKDAEIAPSQALLDNIDIERLHALLTAQSNNSICTSAFIMEKKLF